MGKISELPINIHNDTFSLLQSLSDPDDTEFSDCRYFPFDQTYN